MPIQILVFAHYHENMVIEKEYVMFYEQSIKRTLFRYGHDLPPHSETYLQPLRRDGCPTSFFPHTRNIINEWYAKDTSKKIRAVFRNKGISGQRLSTQSFYGCTRAGDHRISAYRLNPALSPGRSLPLDF